MEPESPQALFRDLRPLAAATPGKPDPHENLTDILEIVGVAAGIRPAHLQGQGQHDEERLAFVERIAHRPGLTTLRTKTLRPYFHRAPRRELIEAENVTAPEKQRRGLEVLWVFADARLAAMISEVVAGRTSVSAVLAYPNCCVVQDSEDKITHGEAYIQGLVDTYHPTTSEEIVSLWQQDVNVQIAVDPDAGIRGIDATLRRFPYVQFTACTTCLTEIDSPAARINRRMRDLAFELSPSFGHQIWQARDLLINRGRPIPVGRNNACPCGSGLKFKRCCLQIDGRPFSSAG